MSFVSALVGEESRSAKARVVLDNPGAAWRPGLAVGLAGQCQPVPVLQPGVHLRPQEAALGQQVAAALAEVFDGGRQRAVEDDDGLHAEATVLGGAQRQHIHPRPVRGRGRRHPQGRDGVGEAGAVHVHRQSVRVGHGGERGHFFDAIDQPGFGGLGDAERGGLRVVRHLGAPACQVRRQVRGQQPRPVAGHPHRAGAAGEPLRRGGLVHQHMGLRMGQHHLPRPDHGCQGDAVGRGAAGDEIRLQIGVKDLAQAVHRPLGPGIAAVPRRSAPVGLDQRLHHAF